VTDKFEVGECGHFCEACARRDDEIKRLRAKLEEAEHDRDEMSDKWMSVYHEIMHMKGEKL
jgi:hypothetical protein